MSDAVAFCNKLISYLGVPYLFGGESPSGFDCSGLIDYCLNATAGTKYIGRTSEDQWYASDHITQGELQPGDFIFEEWPGDQASPGHVVTFAGAGNMVIEAAHTGTNVWIRAWSPSETTIVGYGRDPGMTYDGSSAAAQSLEAFITSVQVAHGITRQAYTTPVPDPTQPTATPVVLTWEPPLPPGPSGRGDQNGMALTGIAGAIDQSPTGTANALNDTDVTSTLISGGLNQQANNIGCPTVTSPNFVPISFVITDPATGTVTTREDCLVSSFVVNTGSLVGATIQRGKNGTAKRAWPEGSSWIGTPGFNRTRLTNAPGATPFIHMDTMDVVQLFGINANITSMSENLYGTPMDNQKLIVEFLDDGNPYDINWGVRYGPSSTLALPTSTPGGKIRMRCCFYFDSTVNRNALVTVT